MKITAAIILSLLITFAITQDQKIPYDFYVFASFWVGSICNLQQCLTNQTELATASFFSIHGLWPDYHNGSFPSYCDNSSVFRPDLIHPTLQQIMDTHWIGLSTSTDSFHDHEWSKHGTCWHDPIPARNYSDKMNAFFAQVVDLSFTYNIYEFLKVHGNIYPSSQPYNLSQFNAVLDKSLKPGSYILQCVQDAKGNQYLADVNLCLDLNLKPYACPAAIQPNFPSQCSQGLIFYPHLNETHALYINETIIE